MTLDIKKLDLRKLSADFLTTVNWMLGDRHGDIIKRDLQLSRTRQTELVPNPDSSEALRLLVELIVTQAWYYKKPQSFDSNMDSFVSKHGINIRTTSAISDLNNIVGKLSPPRIRHQAQIRIQKLFQSYSTLKGFTETLYEQAKAGKHNEVLGEKGRDNYLRDFGYWDRIPIDRHEMRFVLRTGIYHLFSAGGKNDPLEKGSLHSALSFFCSLALSGKVVEGIDLGKAPGIVDIFIWSYCSKERYNICGSSPKCEICQLKGSCLFPQVNIQRLHNLGMIDFRGKSESEQAA